MNNRASIMRYDYGYGRKFEPILVSIVNKSGCVDIGGGIVAYMYLVVPKSPQMKQDGHSIAYVISNGVNRGEMMAQLIDFIVRTSGSASAKALYVKDIVCNDSIMSVADYAICSVLVPRRLLPLCSEIMKKFGYASG